MRMRGWLFPIFVALAGLAHLECQQGTQSNKVSYEGQRVAAVDLVANPKISVDSLRPLVQQRSGEAYSNSKVENTISALKQTGRFSKVELDVKPDPRSEERRVGKEWRSGWAACEEKENRV